MAGNRRARSAAIPVLLSLAVHALLLAAFAFIPSSVTEATPVPIETCLCLALDGQAEIHSSALRPSPGSTEESELDVAVLVSPPLEKPGQPENPPAVSGPPGGENQPKAKDSGQSGPGGADPSGGGGLAGAGSGPGPFLGPVAAHQHVIYLIDRSMSMGPYHAFQLARQELLANLQHLPNSARFQVIAYNRQADPLYLANRLAWLAPNQDTLAQVALALGKLAPTGSTDHGRALRQALVLKPDLIYLVTDGDDLTWQEIDAATRLNGKKTIIHTIELSGRRALRSDSPLRLLAQANRGTYRQVYLAK